MITVMRCSHCARHRTTSDDVVRHRASRHPALSSDIVCAVWTQL